MLTLERAQELLAALGYDPGPADGAFGPKTKRALQMFQVDQHILVTGILDRLTEERLVLESIRRGVDKKMPWWGWAMIAFGSTLALYGIYKLATYKPEEDGEPLYRRAYDHVDRLHCHVGRDQLRHHDQLQLAVAAGPAQPRMQWEMPRYSEPVSSGPMAMREPPQVARVLPPVSSSSPYPPTTRAPAPMQTIFVQEESLPEPPRTERMEYAPMTLPPVASEPPTALYVPIARNLPPPPRRVSLSEILDVNQEAESRARKLASPKSPRYEDVLRNERMRVMDERRRGPR